MHSLGNATALDEWESLLWLPFTVSIATDTHIDGVLGVIRVCPVWRRLQREAVASRLVAEQPAWWSACRTGRTTGGSSGHAMLAFELSSAPYRTLYLSFFVSPTSAPSSTLLAAFLATSPPATAVPTKCPATAPTTHVVGHACHGLSQSSGIGTAPSQAPITVPKAGPRRTISRSLAGEMEEKRRSQT